MVLDDFFTLTEMNNGLTVPSRVKELVAVIQKERDFVVENVGEATRQWSAVASAIAATENQDCLDLFIHLDGLYFIGKWLKDAQKFSNDSSDSFVEESIIHLLQALGKLHVNYEKLVAAEIWTTLKDFLVHNSPKVKDKAQVLIESWTKRRDTDESLSDVEKSRASADDDVGKNANIEQHNGYSESSQKDDSLSGGAACKEIDQESTRGDPVIVASSDTAQPGQLEETFDSDKVSDPSVGDDTPSGHARSPPLPKHAMEMPLCHSVDATSVESCNPAISGEDTVDGRMEFHTLESASNVKHTPKVKSSPDKSGFIEEFNTSEDRPFPASSDAGDAMESVTEPRSQKLDVAGNRSLSDEDSLCINSRKFDSDEKCSTDDIGSANECRNSSEYSTKEVGESSGIEKSRENGKELGALRSGIEDHGQVQKLDLHVSGDNLANDYKFAKKRNA